MGVAGGDGTARGITAHANGMRRGDACTKANATRDAKVVGKCKLQIYSRQVSAANLAE
jgi:hypothetical protein